MSGINASPLSGKTKSLCPPHHSARFAFRDKDCEGLTSVTTQGFKGETQSLTLQWPTNSEPVPILLKYLVSDEIRMRDRNVANKELTARMRNSPASMNKYMDLLKSTHAGTNDQNVRFRLARLIYRLSKSLV